MRQKRGSEKGEEKGEGKMGGMAEGEEILTGERTSMVNNSHTMFNLPLFDLFQFSLSCF